MKKKIVLVLAKILIPQRLQIASQTKFQNAFNLMLVQSYLIIIYSYNKKDKSIKNN